MEQQMKFAMGSIRAKFEAFDWDVLILKKETTLIIAGMTDAKSELEKGNQFVYYIQNNG
jgi:hypothetical protein